MLRERVTTDIATKGGQYDVMTIGTYEVPIWAKQSWLLPLDKLGADYDAGDIIPAIAGGLSVDGKLYAAPFYGESSFIMYRKDLMEKAGLKMPDAPTWEFVADAARKMTDRAADINGICLRGKAGWGENMAFLTAMSNSFGARWFDENWKPQFDQPEWKNTLQFYVDLMKDAGPSGASSNGFNENLALFQQGKCGMWIDATVAASFVSNPKDSTVADKVGYALAPDTGLGKRGNWLWAWSLAIPAGTQKADAAQKFVSWATSKAYLELVASKEGWANVPPGTRSSLYANPEYQKAAPFAKMTLDSINAADPTHPTRQAGALCRRAVRRHPRVPGPRHDRRPAVLGSTCRPDVGRRRAEAGPGRRDQHDDRRRLHPVRHPPGARRRGASSSDASRSRPPAPSRAALPAQATLIAGSADWRRSTRA